MCGSRPPRKMCCSEDVEMIAGIFGLETAGGWVTLFTGNQVVPVLYCAITLVRLPGASVFPTQLCVIAPGADENARPS